MQSIAEVLKQLHRPISSSHKGQNGRLLIIGGSTLFHAASLWSLTVASRIVDLVHYASVKENNQLVTKLKEEFRNGIVIERRHIEDYIAEDDCILIGPGMVRAEKKVLRITYQVSSINDIEHIEDEGVQTYYLTKYLLQKYPQKKWVIDAGALQMLELDWIPQGAILTPHQGEFETLQSRIQNAEFRIKLNNLTAKDKVKVFAHQYRCIVLLKGEVDIVSDGTDVYEIAGGNAGMTKGGTGDVLAGLVAALYCNNNALSSAVASSYINKKAGDALFASMGYWFHASDLASQLPKTMRELLL